MTATEETRPIANIDELVDHFRRAAKPKSSLRVGVEHEKIGVLADGCVPDFDRIEALLLEMAKGGWSDVREAGRLIALGSKKCGTMTLEPGGQIEHSGAPWPTAGEAIADNDKHLDQLNPLAEKAGITFLAIGFRPFGTLDDVPWMPKGRYRVMRAYLGARDTHGHEMMKRTATVQANLDFTDEADAMDKLRVSLSLSSLVTALFAASPIVDGKITDFQSYRARAWLNTDPDRCGLLPFAFAKQASFRDYVEWALDVPMFFIYRSGEYRSLDQVTFRQFLHNGLGDERATRADWELHLTTLFPEARLKKVVELRQADAGSRAMVRALPALWAGVLYDADARRAAWSLVQKATFDERLALSQSVPVRGLKALLGRRSIGPLCSELVQICKAGFGRLGGDVALLAPLENIVREGRTQADVIRETFVAAAGDPQKFTTALRL